MAGLTKEQRAQRAAEKLAAELAAKSNSEQQEQQQEQQEQQQEQDYLVAMVTDFPAFPGAPTNADVHPDEVENWKALGWKETE